MQIDPNTFEHNFYRVLTGVVVPRPIAFVSTVSADGVVNLAPYSFFNAVASDPPTIVFSSSAGLGPRSRIPWPTWRKRVNSWLTWWLMTSPRP